MTTTNRNRAANINRPHKQHQQAPQQHQPAAQHQQAPAQHQQAPAQHHPQPAPKPAPKPQQGYGGSYHGGVQPTEPTHGGVHPSGVPQHSGQVHDGFKQSQAHSWNTEHRSWSQRGGYNGYKSP